MATIALQAAGQGIGAFLGGPVGGVIGRAVGAIAGNVIDQQLFGTKSHRDGPRLSDLRVMSAAEGAAIPRLWGRLRVAGQVIWATSFEEVPDTDTEGTSSKGGGDSGTVTVTDYHYFANFAVALCDGEIDRIGRVWADGKDFDLSSVTARLYKGSETQEPDSLILAKEGAGNAPAYRGIAYLVFERLPLESFGNRLPQLSFEVFRNGGNAGPLLRAVNIIPGSTEFGYDTAVVSREPEEGVTESENAHVSATRSDFSVSVDQLTDECPNLSAAALVVSWFGTDLRCGHCEVKPGVERADKLTEPEDWTVNGITRAAAHLVSQSGGGPAYGGTPSDASVIRAIQDLRARGLATVFYPFVMMDIPAGNTLPDPYGAAAQGTYPWRGRITCALAPGRPGSPDKTAACAAEVQAFLGTAQPADFTASGGTVAYSGPAGWSYRRMVLHYAKLCAAAGGVDAFLIGSELRGLTTLRGAANSFPFVAGLVQLAAEVKAILPGAKVSYAADWSEYFGYHPADGSNDHFFHLDPLWASSSVDFVGIDNYMPLSDWRDGDQHTDCLAGWRSVYDTDYLKANIAGGEGYDWYYASDAARAAQARTAITDGAYGKPWVFRYKDLKSWWSNSHSDRIGGVEQGTATAWTPQSKPIWFTELGCAAVDKATNQPNAFVDPKSAENLLPYFSRGNRDDLIQNRAVVAVNEYWQAAGSHNPVSAVYGGTMVDPSRIFMWCWDARPFPQFPARADLWADAANYDRGHWLNGRIGAPPLGGLIESICRSYGFEDAAAGGVEGLVDGFLIDRPMPARDALEGLLAAYAIDSVESGGLLRFAMRKLAASVAVPEDALVESDPGAALVTLKRAQETELPAAVRLAYIESTLDYRTAAVEARQSGTPGRAETVIQLPAAVSQMEAQMRAEVALQQAWSGREQIEFSLPPSALAVEAGDVVKLMRPGGTILVLIEEISDGSARAVRGRRYDAAVYDAPPTPSRQAAAMRSAPVFGKPAAVMMDLPVATGGAIDHAPWLAAVSRPWPGGLSLYRKTGAASFRFNRAVKKPATMGRLTANLPEGPAHVLDRGSELYVTLTAGALFSVGLDELLDGANVAAVGSPDTGWELLQFAEAVLISPRSYRLTTLLRGQSGSDPEIAPSRSAGQRFVLLDSAVVQPGLSFERSGAPASWRIGPPQYDLARSHLALSSQGLRLGLRPWAPCQLRAARQVGGVLFTWIRRSRTGDDGWNAAEVPLGEVSEAYAVTIRDGAAVKRGTEVFAPQFFYADAAIAADFGADPGTFTISVAQISAVFGPGAKLERTIDV